MSHAMRRVLTIVSTLLLILGVTSCAKKNPGGAKKKGKPETTSRPTGSSADSSGTDDGGLSGGGDIFNSLGDSGAGTRGGDKDYDPYGNGLGSYGSNYGNNSGNQGYGSNYGSGNGYSPTGPNYSPDNPGGSDPNNRPGSGLGPDNDGRRGFGAGGGGGLGAGAGRTPRSNTNDQGNGPRIYLQATESGVVVRFANTSDAKLESSDRSAPVTVKFSQTITTEEKSAALQGSLDIKFKRGSRICSVTSSSYTVSATQDKYRRAQCN